MKTQFLAFSALILTVVSCNTAPQNSNPQSMHDTHVALYERAMDLGDKQTAVIALNYLLLEDTTNLAYTDSLARLYLKGGNLDAGLRLGEKVMEEYPENWDLMELVAVGQSYKGQFIKAQRNLKKLHDETGDVQYIFMIAQVLIEQGNYPQALKKLDLVIADEGTGMFDAPTTAGGVQKIDIKAGAYYFKAQYAFSQAKDMSDGYYKQGVRFLQTCLQLAPNYEAANLLGQNVQMMQQEAAYRQQQQASEDYKKKALEDQRKFEEFQRQQAK